MDSNKKLFTLNDLANVALGTPTLTEEHLGVLQSLLLILLNKLNCQNEKVKIAGFPAQCLKNILNKCQDPPYTIKFQNLHNFQKYYDLLEKLETRVGQMQTKIDKHFDEIRERCYSESFQPHFWDFYAGPTEDLCTLYNDENKRFCTMARNPTFNTEIRRRMTLPIVERMQKFEDQVEAMRKKLMDLGNVADKAMGKIKLIGPIIGEIELKRQEIDKHWSNVREAMNETQEMLTCKLDRIILPALKKYLENRFIAVDDHMALLMKETNQCRPLKLLDVRKKGTCLSCSRCDKLKPTPVLDLVFPNEKLCNCASMTKEPTLLDRMDKIKVKTYKLVAIPRTSSLTSCDDSYASTITQDLRDAGHYVHSYASYNKYRFQDSTDLKPLITVVENGHAKSIRRLRSFDPIKSMISFSGHKSISHTVAILPITKIKSKLNIVRKPVAKSSLSGDLKHKSMKEEYDRQRKQSHAGRPVTISSVNFGYMQ